ncbi:hypothetical protein HNQ92_000348 [Rhabdobacter roseus]|uniref:Uncharacterized protein n=1 Tax=Rhabdobacter roseus TaxID=1655419 RepID=A0A840TK98_9BACT|nr:hypothetical protein [Rhabdobacter roseus]
MKVLWVGTLEAKSTSESTRLSANADQVPGASKRRR